MFTLAASPLGACARPSYDYFRGRLDETAGDRSPAGTDTAVQRCDDGDPFGCHEAATRLDPSLALRAELEDAACADGVGPACRASPGADRSATDRALRRSCAAAYPDADACIALAAAARDGVDDARARNGLVRACERSVDARAPAACVLVGRAPDDAERRVDRFTWDERRRDERARIVLRAAGGHARSAKDRLLTSPVDRLVRWLVEPSRRVGPDAPTTLGHE